MSAKGKSIIHPAVKVEKLAFRASMVTLFPHLGERVVDQCWAQLRTEATVEEIADVARPLHSLARRVTEARQRGRRWRS